MGLAAAVGLAAAPTVLTISDAEAQTALRLRPLAWSGVRSGAQDGMSDVRCGAVTTTGTGTSTMT